MSKQKAPKGQNKKFWKGRYRVNKGDIVVVNSNLTGYMGSVGTVLGYLDKNQVLVRLVGGNTENEWTVAVDVRKYDQEAWESQYAQLGAPDWMDRINPHMIPRIAKVLHRAHPKPKKVKQRKVHLLKTHEELIEALTGDQDIDRKAHVVLALERAQERVDAAQDAQAQEATS